MIEKEQIPKLLSILTAMAVSVAVLLATVGLLSYMVMSKKVQGYAVSDAGQIIPLISLDQPYVTDGRIVGFVDECLRRSFAHDYENFRITMMDAKNCYTPDGAVNYERAMGSLVRDMREKSLVLSVSLDSTVVTRVFKVNGVVHWETQTPIMLFRRGSREALGPLRFLVTSLTQRVPLDHNVRGIALRSINLKPL